MITERLFRIVKSSSFRNSWIAESRSIQQAFVAGLSLYNAVASKTRLFQKKIGKSQGEGTILGKHAVVAPFNIVIGKNCRIADHAILEPGILMGDTVQLGSGTIVGSTGFEIRRIGNRLIPVTHTGGVIIRDNVIIGSHVCIDKSLYGDWTEIGEKTQVGNNVHIAHGVRIGKDCLISSSVMIGGKVILGNAVRIGFGAKISDQLTIGDGAVIAPGSVVTKDVPLGQHIAGNFAISHTKFMNHLQKIRGMPEIQR